MCLRRRFSGHGRNNEHPNETGSNDSVTQGVANPRREVLSRCTNWKKKKPIEVANSLIKIVDRRGL